MSKRLFALLATLIVASILLAACGGPAFECTDAIGCVDIAPDEPVHISYMLTISGVTAFLGQDSVGGIEIAIDDSGGESLGHHISSTNDDQPYSAEDGQTAATKVAAAPTILGAVGTNCSSATTSAVQTFSDASLVKLSPSNTAPVLAIEGITWQDGYFRIYRTDLFLSSVAAEFADSELGATTAATIHDGSSKADQLQHVFASRFQNFGETITFQGEDTMGLGELAIDVMGIELLSHQFLIINEESLYFAEDGQTVAMTTFRSTSPFVLSPSNIYLALIIKNETWQNAGYFHIVQNDPVVGLVTVVPKNPDETTSTIRVLI